MPNPYTIVDAINQITEIVTEFPMGGSLAPSALAVPDTVSLYARAEQFLDRARYQILSMGWPENTEMATQLTVTGGKVSLPNTTYLSVKASGPDSFRTVVIRYDTVSPAGYKAYDSNARSFTFSNATLFLDTVLLLSWTDLTQKLADLVIAKAKVAFQREIGKNDQQHDLQLSKELNTADELVDRNKAVWSPLAPNSKEQAVQQNQQGQQSQQGQQG